MEQEITLDALKKQAFEERNLALFNFYDTIQHRLERLQAVGRVVASLYHKGGLTEEGWQNLFEALFDAGLLDEEAQHDE